MDDVSPAHEVREAVYGLNGLMFRTRRAQNKALPFWEGVKPAELESQIKQLESGLHKAGVLLRNPQAGQGLDSLYVRVVATRFTRFEQWRLSLCNGWGDVLRQDGNDDLDWLGGQAPGLGTDLNGWAARGPSGVARLLEPEKLALDRLREKAVDWAPAFADAPDEPQGAMGRRELLNAWAPWRKKRDDFIKACGRLLLEAIDQCEITADQMTDAAFAEATLTSLSDDGNSLLSALCGRDFGPNEVMQLVERFTEQAKPDSNSARGAEPESQNDDGAGEVATDGDEPQSIESIELQTPKLEMGNGEWVSAKVASTHLGVTTKTLSNHRCKGERIELDGEHFGRHDEHCLWRKVGNSHPLYHLPTLVQQAGHLSVSFPTHFLKELKSSLAGANRPANRP